MSDKASLVSGVSGRYASALFDIALEAKSLPEIEQNLDALSAALAESSDLRDLISSPIYSRGDQSNAIVAVAAALGLGDMVKNTLAVMADKRRLGELSGVIKGFKALAAEHRGELTADVKSAKPLTKAHSEALAKVLKEATGKDVVMNVSVDESLIGGLIVKVGSKMIDSSIRSKLASLQNAMKEVG